MPTVATSEFEYALAHQKQTNISTALAAGLLDKVLPFRGYAPIEYIKVTNIDDANQSGKGHDFPTRNVNIKNRGNIPSRGYEMSPTSALYAFSHVMGNHSVAQPDATGAPTVYDHTLTFKDKGTTPECHYTSLAEKAGGEYQNIHSGVVFSQVTVQAGENDNAVLSLEGISRTKAADATAIPALTVEPTFFRLLYSSISFGADGSPASIENRVRSFNCTISQDPKPFWHPDTTEATSKLVASVMRGVQSCQFDLSVYLTAADLTLFENHTACELTVIFKGANISGSYDYQVTISIPTFYISSATFEEEEEQSLWRMTSNPGAVIKNGAAEPVTVTIRSTDDGTTVLV